MSKKKNSNPLAAACRIHAKKRMEERYGIILNQKSYREMTLLIRFNNEHKGKLTRFVDKQSNNRRRWFVKYQDRWFPVAYDRKLKTIVTILPEEALGPFPTD